MAVFAYQLVFFAWMKLDTDDIRSSRQGMPPLSTACSILAANKAAEIASLETQVKELQAAKKA